jgi:hypothetical protein
MNSLWEFIIAIAAAGALLAVGIQIGRDVERVNVLAAMPGPGKIIIGKSEAWHRMHSTAKRPGTPREDLRVP